MSDITRRQMVSNWTVNAFYNALAVPPATWHTITAPNSDTLYSWAWLNLTTPILFEYPDVPDDRYFVFPIYDMFMDVVYSLGSRTTGNKKKLFLITGPNFDKISLGSDIIHLPMDTLYALILGRTYFSGTAKDLKTVHKLQAKYTLKPVDVTTHTNVVYYEQPKINYTDNPKNEILKLTTIEYFDYLRNLLTFISRPRIEDNAFLNEIKALLGDDYTQLNRKLIQLLEPLPLVVLEILKFETLKLYKGLNYWKSPTVIGNYGTNYMARACIAAFGYASNINEDCVYCNALKTSDFLELNGRHDYIIHFENGLLPPVHAFWSITLYIPVDDGWYFYPNSMNKFDICVPRDELVYNDDGSLYIYLQSKISNNSLVSNLIPTPFERNFILTMRLYWPNHSPPSILPITNSTWLPPYIKKIV